MFHHTTAIFRQVDKDNPHTHHDALEFPDGQMVLLNDLFEGQRATVLQARWRWLCKFFSGRRLDECAPAPAGSIFL